MEGFGFGGVGGLEEGCGGWMAPEEMGEAYKAQARLLDVRAHSQWSLETRVPGRTTCFSSAALTPGQREEKVGHGIH